MEFLEAEIYIYYFENTHFLTEACIWFGCPPHTLILCTWNSAQGFSVLLWVTVVQTLPQEVRNQFQFFDLGVPTPLSGFGSAAHMGTAEACHPALATYGPHVDVRATSLSLLLPFFDTRFQENERFLLTTCNLVVFYINSL